MRRYLVVGAVVLALVAAGVVALVIAPRMRAPSEPDVRRARVQSGDIAITISAAGSVEPKRVARLFFPADVVGVVEEVRVDVGDRVGRDQMLARVGTASLRIAREQAQLNYEIQQLANQKLVKPPDDNDLAAARAELGAASARYGDVANPDPETLEIERLQAEQAVHGYRAADITHDALKWRTSAAVKGNAHAKAGIAWVEAQMALLEYQQMLAGPRPEDLAVASAEVALAAAELKQAEAGPAELEIERADIQLEQAQIAIERAREELAGAILRAPFEGVVSAVNLEEASPPPALVPAIEIVDDSRFHIDVQVDEVDIGRVEVGQPVYIELDALPDRRLTGQVASIAPGATADSGGAVSYTVRVDLDPTDAPLRSGMTATVDIVVEELQGVLRIPNWAIRIDRRTGDTFVNIHGPDGGLLEVEVELGLRGDAYSQVLSGLEKGQEVLVSLEREELSFFGGGE